MTDDPDEIRAAARKVSTLATRARHEAHRVTMQGAVHWSSVAAARYRDRLSDRANDFTQRARDLDALARALLAHARQVEDHERVIAQAAHAMVGDVKAVADDVKTIAGETRDLVTDAVGLIS